MTIEANHIFDKSGVTLAVFLKDNPSAQAAVDGWAQNDVGL